MQFTLVILNPRYVGHIPARKGADRREQDVRDVLKLLCLASVVHATDADVPLPRRLVVPRVHDLVIELDVAHELILVDDALEVLMNLVTGRIDCRPVAL